LIKQPPGMAGGRLVKAATKPHFSGMRHLVLIFLHLVGSLVKLLKPDGAKASLSNSIAKLLANCCAIFRQPKCGLRRLSSVMAWIRSCPGPFGPGLCRWPEE
jgi:hypothetical protein